MTNNLTISHKEAILLDYLLANLISDMDLRKNTRTFRLDEVNYTQQEIDNLEERIGKLTHLIPAE